MHRDGDWHAALHIWVGGVGESGLQLARGDTAPRVVAIAVEDFAVADRDGYAALALRSLAEALAGRTPQPFELR